MSFSREQLLSFRGHGVDDLVSDDVRLLFVGINPGLWTAATGKHFARSARQNSATSACTWRTSWQPDPA